MSDALIEAAEAQEARKRDLKILAWFHLIELMVCDGHKKFKLKHKKEYLYQVMHTHLYQTLLDRAGDEYETDEVPTEWMRRVYKDYEDYYEWRKARGETKIINEQIKFDNKRRGIE